jgi:hypothetical protein
MQVAEVIAHHVRTLIGVARPARRASTCPDELIHDPIPDLGKPDLEIWHDFHVTY